MYVYVFLTIRGRYRFLLAKKIVIRFLKARQVVGTRYLWQIIIRCGGATSGLAGEEIAWREKEAHAAPY